MTMPFQDVNQFIIRQNFRPLVNQYVVHLVEPDGKHGPAIAFAQQKRGKLKEEVILYTDDTKTTELARFKARQMLDIKAQHDVTGVEGKPLGMFSKNFKKSIIRSTWHLERPDAPAATGQERSLFGAILRRVWGMIPYVGAWLPAPTYHFDFVTDEGAAPVLHIERQMKLRDQYLLTMPDPTMDRRLAICVAVAMDAIQNR
jgi:uncharacterized protein YxjI